MMPCILAASLEGVLVAVLSLAFGGAVIALAWGRVVLSVPPHTMRRCGRATSDTPPDARRAASPEGTRSPATSVPTVGAQSSGTPATHPPLPVVLEVLSASQEEPSPCDEVAQEAATDWRAIRDNVAHARIHAIAFLEGNALAREAHREASERQGQEMRWQPKVVRAEEMKAGQYGQEVCDWYHGGPAFCRVEGPSEDPSEPVVIVSHGIEMTLPADFEVAL